MSVSIGEPNLLLVEGQNDARFCGALLRHLGISGVQVPEVGGKGQFCPWLKALVRTPGFDQVKVVLAVRDADENAQGAFQSIRDAFRDAGLPVPNQPGRLTDKVPRVGVEILPGEGRPGNLEHLCLTAIADDPALPCLDQFFGCPKKNGLSRPRDMSKAKVQVFLASRPKPGLRLGEAAEAAYWPWEAAAFGGLKQFLRLFAVQ